MRIFRDSLAGLGMRSWSVDIALLLSCPAGAVLLQFGWWRTWYANVSVATAACMSYADFLPPTLFGVSHEGHEVNIWSVRSWKHIFRTNTVEQCNQHLGEKGNGRWPNWFFDGVVQAGVGQNRVPRKAQMVFHVSPKPIRFVSAVVLTQGPILVLYAHMIFHDSMLSHAYYRFPT